MSCDISSTALAMKCEGHCKLNEPVELSIIYHHPKIERLPSKCFWENSNVKALAAVGWTNTDHLQNSNFSCPSKLVPKTSIKADEALVSKQTKYWYQNKQSTGIKVDKVLVSKQIKYWYQSKQSTGIKADKVLVLGQTNTGIKADKVLISKQTKNCSKRR